MIPEKMLELLLLTIAGTLIEDEDAWILSDRKYDTDRMKERIKEIMEEFLEPYAIDSDSKE